MIKSMASVILPTCNRYDICEQNVVNICKQNYKSFEIVVCDDSDAEYYKSGSEQFQDKLKKFDHKVKYFYTAMFDIDGKKDYGLARARNRGIVESEGEYLVFLDDRMTPNKPDVIKNFIDAMCKNKKKWFFGDKGAQKTSFVENFSAIRKSEIVDAGFFFERVNKYGGMTKELHGRFTRQGFNFVYLPECTAEQLCKSSGWERKEKEIPEMKDMLKRMFSR